MKEKVKTQHTSDSTTPPEGARASSPGTTRAELPPATRTSPYRGIPAVREYQRYAAKVETPSSSGS